MQKALDEVPALKKMSGNVQKHVTLSCEISKLIEERTLLEISKIEQQIACNKSSEHYNVIIFKFKLINKFIHKIDFS